MRTAIEALFDAIVSGGWANRSDGNVEAPTGHFAMVSNSPDELLELRQAFEDVTDVYGDVSDADLTGHFIVITDSAGFISITRYPSAVSAASEFVTLQNRFAAWNEEN